MGSTKQPKISVRMVSLEIIKAKHAHTLPPLKDKAVDAMPRDELLAIVERYIQRDRLDLSDAQFRQKYVHYIRNYWGGRGVGEIGLNHTIRL